MSLPPSARRGLPSAEARHRVDARRHKDSEPRGDTPAAARSLHGWSRTRHPCRGSMIHVCAATSACWMTGTVQLLEPQPEACVKDSAIAARRAAVGQIGRTACLYVCPRLSLGARRCNNNFRTLRCCECPREKMTGNFYTAVILHMFPSLSTQRRQLLSPSNPVTPRCHARCPFCVNCMQHARWTLETH